MEVINFIVNFVHKIAAKTVFLYTHNQVVTNINTLFFLYLGIVQVKVNFYYLPKVNNKHVFCFNLVHVYLLIQFYSKNDSIDN